MKLLNNYRLTIFNVLFQHEGLGGPQETGDSRIEGTNDGTEKNSTPASVGEEGEGLYSHSRASTYITDRGKEAMQGTEGEGPKAETQYNDQNIVQPDSPETTT